MFQLVQLNSAPPDRVVVIGSSGVIGTALIDALREAKIPTFAISSSDIDLLASDAAETLAKQLLNSDTLVMLSALTPDRGRDVGTLIKNLQMANAVCTAIKISPVSHIIYMSSDAVYAFSNEIISETTPSRPSDLYGNMHRVREIMFEELGSEIPIAFLRCTMVLAENDTHKSYGPNLFRRQAQTNGKIVLAGKGEEIRDHISVVDVARLVTEVIQHQGRGVLNIASGDSFSFSEVANFVASAMDKKPELIFSKRRLPITHRQFDSTLIREKFPKFTFTPLPAAIRSCHRKLGLLS
jgi:UDP-glucose 4-epimerase